MNLRIIYSEQPTCPVTDQHPSAVRYKIGNYWVDSVNGEPIAQQLTNVLAGRSQDDNGA